MSHGYGGLESLFMAILIHAHFFKPKNVVKFKPLILCTIKTLNMFVTHKHTKERGLGRLQEIMCMLKCDVIGFDSCIFYLNRDSRTKCNWYISTVFFLESRLCAEHACVAIIFYIIQL